MGISLLWLLIGSFALAKGTTIENARAIVTGGANGIGYHCAHDLLNKGAQAVVILDIDVRNGSMAARRLNHKFGAFRALFFVADVSDPYQFEAGFEIAVQFLGGLDIMINNAGFMDDSRWSEMIDLNVKGLIQGTLMSFDVMGKHKGGSGGTVINIGSIASFMVNPYTPVYSATKYAVVGFSRGIAMNYDKTGVAIKTMCPGGTDTLLMRSTAPRFLDFIDKDEAVEFLKTVPLQKPEVVSKEVMRLIEDGSNGAIWVTVLDSPTLSLDIPEYTEWGTPV